MSAYTDSRQCLPRRHTESQANMKCLVTGAAGFIGSHLCEELLRQGHSVIGVDAFIDYYDRSLKEANLHPAKQNSQYTFHELDLRHDSLDDLLTDVEVIFHEAAMAGLLKSWSEFDLYLTCNVQATQRLLDAIRSQAPPLKKLVYCSTSSVYGLYSSGDETLPTKPISPYGVTKLASENLCRAYFDAFDLPVVVLRYFSVYGPRQRPDMGYHKFIKAALEDQTVTVFGDGHQARGNTYVADCVDATIRAVDAQVGEVYNVGGGESASVWDILRLVEKISGKTIPYHLAEGRPGDQRITFADTSRLRRHLGWEPRTTLEEGILAQWKWQQSSS